MLFARCTRLPARAALRAAQTSPMVRVSMVGGDSLALEHTGGPGKTLEGVGVGPVRGGG